MISFILGAVSSRASHAADKERTKKDNFGMAGPYARIRPIAGRRSVGRTLPLRARKGKSNSQTEIPVGPEISLLLA